MAKDGEPNCEAQRNALLARDFQQPALYWQFHRLAIDAYCVQHSSYIASAKSLAAHLCGLCIAFELADKPEKFRQLQQWLSRNPPIVKPKLPSFKGILTIGSVQAISEPAAYGRAVERWAASAWQAYEGLHPLAREWISLSAADARK